MLLVVVPKNHGPRDSDSYRRYYDPEYSKLHHPGTKLVTLQEKQELLVQQTDVR